MTTRLPALDSLQSPLREQALAALSTFEKSASMREVRHHVKSRADGTYLVIGLAFPGERHYALLETALASLPQENPFRERTTIERWSHDDRLDTAETRLLQRVLSETLTVGRNSFRDDFFARYIRSVSGEEEKIESAANHVVFGRRGAGKSSLLVYAMRRLEEENSPFAWVDMQTFGGRGDNGVIVQVLIDIIEQLRPELEREGDARLQNVSSILGRLRSTGPSVTTEAIRDALPEVKRLISPLAQAKSRVTLFIDDLHVLQPVLQPALLASLYAFSRGNSIHLKVSAIENLARIWEQSSSLGLEFPNDAQAIRLDHNLTMPDKSLAHITKILDAHARYCALPSSGFLSSKDVLERLVWVAAAVPRDAINIFSQAITRASTNSRKQVAVTDVNLAASQATEDKMRNLKEDSSGGSEELIQLLERIKKFCSSEGKNAFLALVSQSNPTYESILKLVGLRFLHVLSTGITPDQAGERYMALMLDYGLYVSVRRARSMDLFQKTPKSVPYQELRKLPRFESESSSAPRPSRRQPIAKQSRRSATKH